MARLFVPFLQAIDANGAPISGAQLFFYITGTTTAKNTFSDSGLMSANANPVVADSSGRFPAIYLAQDADYKAILKDASNVALETLDPLLVNSTSVISTQGDIIIGNSSGADSRLAINATVGAHLASNGTTLVWQTGNLTQQKFTSGSGTYTTPAGCVAIRIRLQAGGGGGGGTGQTTGPTGATGGTSSFNSITAIGGTGGTGGTNLVTGRGGIGGTGGSGTAARISGGAGTDGASIASLSISGPGGNGALGGGGKGASDVAGTGATGGAGAINSGGGGAGSLGGASVTLSGGGGGAGENAEFIIVSPSATYSYVVGAGGAGGIGTGTGAQTGGAGATGIIIIDEYYV